MQIWNTISGIQKLHSSSSSGDSIKRVRCSSGGGGGGGSSSRCLHL